jgi:hypothetical protein
MALHNPVNLQFKNDVTGKQHCSTLAIRKAQFMVTRRAKVVNLV